MPEYLSPGVYVEEIEIGSKPIEGVSTSTAGFLGEAERGPTTPRLVASWLQFHRVFGSFFGANKYLPYAVQGFFDNGGRRCYIGRIVKAGAAPATMATLKLAGGSDELTVDATGEGEWGNNIALKISAGTMSGFKLKVFYWKAAPIDEGTQWVVFEPNNEKLWGRVIATVTAFLTRVWRDGALMGTKPEEAFFVKCDRTTMTQDDIDNGRLICIIGGAPVKPAEFVMFRIAQWAGGSSVTE